MSSKFIHVANGRIFFFEKVNHGAGEMTQGLGELAAFAEDPGLILSTHRAALVMTHNSSSRGSDACGAYTHTSVKQINA